MHKTSYVPTKPDISPDQIRRHPVKILIRLAFTALSLSFGMAHAASMNPHAPAQQGINHSFVEGG
jgi:hypothetical protein